MPLLLGGSQSLHGTNPCRVLYSLFQEKDSESTRCQTSKIEMPARLAASTKQDAIQMLRESKTGTDQAPNSGLRPVSIDKRRMHRHQDLASISHIPQVRLGIFLGSEQLFLASILWHFFPEFIRIISVALTKPHSFESIGICHRGFTT